MKVINWIDYPKDDIELKGLKENEFVGGMGGWFGFSERNTWEDYINVQSEESKPYYEALREEIISKNIQLTGDRHQHGKKGVPLFEDNTYATFSYRGWGDLMAAIHTTKEKPLNYMDYYM